MFSCLSTSFFFFFNDTATTEIYTLSLHDALPILFVEDARPQRAVTDRGEREPRHAGDRERSLGDRKSTRLNSSHGYISYAVFCLKKKKIFSVDVNTPYWIILIFVQPFDNLIICRH